MNDRLDQIKSNRQLAEAYASGDSSTYPEVLRLSLAEGFTVQGWVRWYTGISISTTLRGNSAE